MKSKLKMRNKVIKVLTAMGIAMTAMIAMAQDTVPSMFSLPLEWKVGAQVAPAWVPGTSSFLRGQNLESKRIDTGLSGGIRAGFSFNPSTREGMLYPGLYQGMGVDVNSYFCNALLGTPISTYVYQGAPIKHLSPRLWLGYEWQFGVASGWKHHEDESPDNNAVVSTAVTAHMALGLKLHYALSDRWSLSAGVVAKHFSNGNTSWPNAGLNSIGASIGLAYVLNPQTERPIPSKELEAEADRHRWTYDITAFGAWRKRVVRIGEPPTAQICPGRFGILGVQFSPLYALNRWAAVGPALDLQWDEGAGLQPYWVEGSEGKDIKFTRPPFGKQISAGLSAHAELTMPIFSVNVGLGWDALCPDGNNRFYQSLTLKTFVTKNIFINTGYRLGRFKTPQNLMVGVGVRL